MNHLNSYIPRFLNAQPLFFMWELDNFVVAFVPFLIMAMFGGVVIGLIAGYLVAKMWISIKADNDSGIVIRLFYWYMYSGFLVEEENLRSEITEYIG